MSIRTIRTSVVAAVAAVALATGGVFAGRLLAGSFPPGHGPGGGFGGPRMLGRMARALELTDEQKSDIKRVLRAHGAEIEAQMQAGADARRQLHDAMLADPIDESAIRERAGRLGQVQADGAVLFARIRTEIAPLLTAEQKERFANLREKMRDRGRRSAREFSEFLRKDAF